MSSTYDSASPPSRSSSSPPPRDGELEVVELDQVPGKDKQFTGYVPPFIGISEQHHTPPRLDELEAGFYMRRFWVEAAIIVTWACIIILSLYCLACIAVALEDTSSALLAYGIESVLDVLSSFFVVWRFWGAWGKEMLSPGDRREKKASVGISIFFVLLASVVIAAAIEQFITKTKPEDASRIIILSAIGFVLSVIMGIAKLKVAYETSSSVLKKDAWASFAGAVLSLGTFLGALIFQVDEDFWWIDPTVATITGIFLALYGLRTLIVYRWWTREFWY